jgi:hypothetical protein
MRTQTPAVLIVRRVKSLPESSSRSRSGYETFVAGGFEEI